MKSILVLLGITIFFALGVVAGHLLFYVPPQPPEIVEIIKHETQYIKVAANCDQLRECYESPITIDAEMRGGVMHIDAGDACKTAAADVKMECRPKPDWWGRGIAAALGAALAILLL